MKISSCLVIILVATISSCKEPVGRKSVDESTDKYDNYIDWAIYRGDKKSNQYSEVAQINAANVHKLEPV